MNLRALPLAGSSYLRALTDHVCAIVGTNIVGAYLFGSAAYGAYRPGRSDLDVQVVVSGVLTQAQRLSLAYSLAHITLPCPARRLEFVCYTRAAVDPATRHPHFLLNFNTGGDLTVERLVLDPAEEASHWFLLDIAMGRALGRALFGPPPARVFAPIPRRWCLEALVDSLRWPDSNEVASINSLQNACRGCRYAATDTFGSKEAGASWARRQSDCPPTIAAALDPTTGLTVSAVAARAFVRFVADEVAAALVREAPPL